MPQGEPTPGEQMIASGVLMALGAACGTLSLLSAGVPLGHAEYVIGATDGARVVEFEEALSIARNGTTTGSVGVVAHVKMTRLDYTLTLGELSVTVVNLCDEMWRLRSASLVTIVGASTAGFVVIMASIFLSGVPGLRFILDALLSAVALINASMLLVLYTYPLCGGKPEFSALPDASIGPAPFLALVVAILYWIDMGHVVVTQGWPKWISQVCWKLGCLGKEKRRPQVVAGVQLSASATHTEDRTKRLQRGMTTTLFCYMPAGWNVWKGMRPPAALSADFSGWCMFLYLDSDAAAESAREGALNHHGRIYKIDVALGAVCTQDVAIGSPLDSQKLNAHSYDSLLLTRGGAIPSAQYVIFSQEQVLSWSEVPKAPATTTLPPTVTALPKLEDRLPVPEENLTEPLLLLHSTTQPQLSLDLADGNPELAREKSVSWRRDDLL